MPCFDVMVDVETTGTDPEHSAMIQLAAVRFNAITQELDHQDMFCRSLLIPHGRFWSEDTRVWWANQKMSVLQGIMDAMEDPAVVMADFAKWCGYSHSEPLRFWAKPISFDFPFCSSYFRQFGISNPFHFRNAVDLNSYMKGLKRDPSVHPQTQASMSVDAHHALNDVIFQIDQLFHANEGKWI